MKSGKLLIICISILSFCLGSCQRKPEGNGEGTSSDSSLTLAEGANRGEIWISIDESLKPIMEQLLTVFHSDRPKAIIHAKYLPEADAMQELLNDSARIVVTTRNFRKEEEDFLRRKQIIPRSTKIGYDAIALISHRDNPRDSISLAELMALVKGQKTTWADLGEKGNEKKVLLAFDHSRSGTLRQIQEEFLGDGKVAGNAFGVNGTDSVFHYVAGHPDAIGFVGLSWICDLDDPEVKKRLEGVNWMRMDAPDTTYAAGKFVQPKQSELTLGYYPLKRPILALSREHFIGLGTGFVHFCEREQGQRILLKAGLLPENMPPRFVILPEKED